MIYKIEETTTPVHINEGNMIRLATGKNSKNETTRLVNAPTKEMTVGEMTILNETIGTHVAIMDKEIAVGNKTRSNSPTTTGIAPNVRILISVSVKIATNVTHHAQVVGGNQNPETMGKETGGIIKTTTHTMTGIVQSVRIPISVSVKNATNVMPLDLALQAIEDKSRIQDIMVQTTEVEEVLAETIEVKVANAQTTEVEVTLVEMMEDEAVNVQTIETEEALEEMMEDMVANVQIKEVENHLHNTANREVKVRTMHIIDPQRK